uniref:Uncharacterized protein n=1 Tax=Hippocampus comes TaxID=109280 RepID=A0A3Q2XUF7_HIPCM
IHFTISLQKLQQKAPQQPKQKKSKSAEFLMGESLDAAGMENPAFDAGGSAEPSLLPVWPPREIQGDRADSALALQASAKERGNESARNDFDPISAEQTDSRRGGVAAVCCQDELELTTLKAAGNGLQERRMVGLLDEEDTCIDMPGTVVASGDEEALEVKAGKPLLLHGGWDGAASGSEPSQASTHCQNPNWAQCELGLQAVRTVMGRGIKTSEEVVARRARPARERARADMITLGSLSLQQVSYKATKRNICVMVPYSPARRPHPLCRVRVAQANGQRRTRACDLRLLFQTQPSAAPQPVEVCVRCLRATRDKLPRGLYSVSVALHSRLGGPSLAWNRERGRQEGMASTDPIEHQGCFYDTTLHINQNLFMIFPPACEILPCMVLIFRLTASPGQSGYMKSVPAWGAFPICGPSLGLLHGRYKTPLLRGEPSTQVDQFQKIEALISSDLDNWLCNLYFQIRKLPLGASGSPECPVARRMPPLRTPAMLQPAVRHDRPPGRAPSGSKPDPQPTHPQLNPLHAGPSGGAGERAGMRSPRGSPLHLSADSACSSSSLPGRGFMYGCIQTVYLSPMVHHCCEMHKCYRGLSQSRPLQNSVRSAQLFKPAHLVLRILPSELGLALLRQQLHHHHHHHHRHQQQPCGCRRVCALQLSLIMLLLALMWFVRLYLHYCSQWLYLQAIAVPVNKFRFHAYTVDLVYQSSLLHTREELVMVAVGPLTLNAVTFLLVLIRCGCQQIFGSLPSFTSKLIMAQGVWTVLHPLAVLAVDAVLGRLSYDPDRPVGDAAKLFWHFQRVDRSGAAGVAITVFLYAVIFLLSLTILGVYLLRFHNNGRMLDIFQRLTAKEGTYFLPRDLELSNQELSYIVKKAEQWRGFHGERRKVTVYDYMWTAENPSAADATPTDERHQEPSPLPQGETSTHVAIHTLYVGGLKQRYRHFLRRPDGAIVEVRHFGGSPALFAEMRREDGDLQLQNRERTRVQPCGAKRASGNAANLKNENPKGFPWAKTNVKRCFLLK